MIGTCFMKIGKKIRSIRFPRIGEIICRLSMIISLRGLKLQILSLENLITHLGLISNEKWKIIRKVREIKRFLGTNINLEIFQWYFRNWRKVFKNRIFKKKLCIKIQFKKMWNKSRQGIQRKVFKKKIRFLSLNHA